MKTIKLFTTLICMVTIISVNAQTSSETKPENKSQVRKKEMSVKKPSNVPKASLSNDAVKIDEKDSKSGKKDKNTSTTPAQPKKEQPSDKTKMKQIKRPVKVTPK
jgi:hypothetical protein